jgi:Fe-S oxidoreductase
VVGLEPSCLLTFRDEMQSLGLGEGAARLGGATFLIEEVLAADLAAGRITLPLADQGGRVAHVHGHCHQKSLGAFPPVQAILAHVPGLTVKVIDSACCGMAGAFGHQAETLEASRAMGELSLLPAVRAAGVEDLVVADGTSCRKQISDGAGRPAVHVVQVLASALQLSKGYI